MHVTLSHKKPVTLCQDCRCKPAVTNDKVLCFGCLRRRLNEEVPYECSRIREGLDRRGRDPRVLGGAPF